MGESENSSGIAVVVLTVVQAEGAMLLPTKRMRRSSLSVWPLYGAISSAQSMAALAIFISSIMWAPDPEPVRASDLRPQPIG